jgi:hypothetical protein
MRKDVLRFLKNERDQLAERLRMLQQGEWEVVRVNGGRENITAQVATSLEHQLLRFEELVAASETGIA